MSASARLISELLSPREREVLELVAQGRTNESIAHGLSVALKTVETVIGSVFDKLGLIESPDSIGVFSAVVRSAVALSPCCVLQLLCSARRL